MDVCSRFLALLGLIGFLGGAFLRRTLRLLLVLLCFFRILAAVGRSRRLRLFGVVGHVPARAFELHGRRGDGLFHATSAFGAFLDELVGKFLDLFEEMAALLTLIFVKWHGF